MRKKEKGALQVEERKWIWTQNWEHKDHLFREGVEGYDTYKVHWFPINYKQEVVTNRFYSYLKRFLWWLWRMNVLIVINQRKITESWIWSVRVRKERATRHYKGWLYAIWWHEWNLLKMTNRMTKQFMQIRDTRVYLWGSYLVWDFNLSCWGARIHPCGNVHQLEIQDWILSESLVRWVDLRCIYM